MFDTERLSVEAWNIVGKRFGISVGDEFFDGIRGSKPDTVKRLLNEMFGPEFDTDRFLEEKRAFSYDQIRKYGVPVKKGLKELLTYLKEKGIKTAVATSSGRQWTEQNVGGAGIDGFFDAYAFGEMVTHAKPDPEIYQLACQALGTAPSRTLAIEDSRNGILSAHAAGMPVVMIPDLIPPAPELERLLFRRCTSLLEVRELLDHLLTT